MEGIKSIIKFNPVKASKTQQWQEAAILAIQKLVDGKEHKASIFKAFKVDSHRAKIALLDCNELEKPHAMYFFKVFSEIRKVQ